MIYRKLGIEDLDASVAGLLRNNDCSPLYYYYTHYSPDDIFGAFDGDTLVGIIAARDSVDFYYYSVSSSQIEHDLKSIVFGAYVAVDYRKQGIFGRLFHLARAYSKRHYVVRDLVTWPIAVYKKDVPIVNSLNKDCWVEHPRVDYNGLALHRPLTYTDVSIRADNYTVCSKLRELNFNYIGLNAFDNSPIFASTEL